MSKNDFMYFQPASHYNSTGMFVVFAGGRLKLPVWLLWTTWGIIAAAILLWETVTGIVAGTFMSSFPYGLTTLVLLGTAGLVGLFWAPVGLGYVVRAWVRAFKGAM